MPTPMTHQYQNSTTTTTTTTTTAGNDNIDSLKSDVEAVLNNLAAAFEQFNDLCDRNKADANGNDKEKRLNSAMAECMQEQKFKMLPLTAQKITDRTDKRSMEVILKSLMHDLQQLIKLYDPERKGSSNMNLAIQNNIDFSHCMERSELQGLPKTFERAAVLVHKAAQYGEPEKPTQNEAEAFLESTLFKSSGNPPKKMKPTPAKS